MRAVWSMALVGLTLIGVGLVQSEAEEIKAIRTFTKSYPVWDRKRPHTDWIVALKKQVIEASGPDSFSKTQVLLHRQLPSLAPHQHQLIVSLMMGQLPEGVKLQTEPAAYRKNQESLKQFLMSTGVWPIDDALAVSMMAIPTEWARFPVEWSLALLVLDRLEQVKILFPELSAEERFQIALNQSKIEEFVWSDVQEVLSSKQRLLTLIDHAYEAPRETAYGSEILSLSKEFPEGTLSFEKAKSLRLTSLVMHYAPMSQYERRKVSYLKALQSIPVDSVSERLEALEIASRRTFKSDEYASSLGYVLFKNSEGAFCSLPFAGRSHGENLIHYAQILSKQTEDNPFASLRSVSELDSVRLKVKDFTLMLFFDAAMIEHECLGQSAVTKPLPMNDQIISYDDFVVGPRRYFALTARDPLGGGHRLMLLRQQSMFRRGLWSECPSMEEFAWLLMGESLRVLGAVLEVGVLDPERYPERVDFFASRAAEFRASKDGLDEMNPHLEIYNLRRSGRRSSRPIQKSPTIMEASQYAEWVVEEILRAEASK